MATSRYERPSVFHAFRRGRRGERGTSVTEFALTLPAVILMWCLTIDGGHVFLSTQRAAAALASALDYAAGQTNFDPDATVRIACNNLIGTKAVKGLTDPANCIGSIVTLGGPVDDIYGGRSFTLTAAFSVPAILPIKIPTFGGQVYTLRSGYPINMTKTGHANAVALNTQAPS